MVLLSSDNDFALATVATRPDEAGGPPPSSSTHYGTTSSIGFIWVFPLVFASSAFVPAGTMPGAVRAFADVNPVTLVVDAARALMIGDGGALEPALGTLAWLAGLLLVFVPLSVRAFRKA